jgi:hypothetical protein
MKGPMTTQSLRGMANHGPMHWRGDRTGGNEAASVQPDSGTFNEDAAFKKFNPAFEGLIGRNAQLTPTEMQQFTDFILQVTYPPNPIRNLDNSQTTRQQLAQAMFQGQISDTLQNCDGCHRLLPTANATLGVAAPGFFGTDGQSTFEGESQIFKIPHLRNMYQKVGMFGLLAGPGGGAGFTGDQVRGFGFLHDGSVDTLFRFHSAALFSQAPNNPGGFAAGPAGDVMRRNMEAFMMAFDSNLAPIVGQQTTRTASNGATVDPRISLLEQRAAAGECDLVAKGEVAGEMQGALYVGSGLFLTDRAAEAPISDATVRARAATAGQEVTFTCVPPGSGGRIGIDEDGDGYADGDERDAATDPANPASTPSNVALACTSSTTVTFKRATLSDRSGVLSLSTEIDLGNYAQAAIGIAAADGDGPIMGDGVAGSLIEVRGSGFRYHAPKGELGIKTITVREKPNSGGIFKITLRTRDAWPDGAADEDAASTLVTLNVGGTCFRGAATKVH